MVFAGAVTGRRNGEVFRKCNVSVTQDEYILDIS